MIQPMRGFRDFYPDDQAKLNYLQEKIQQVCALFGYEQVEGPALEPFELYAAKSSDEIVNEQAFVFEDRGGEKVALRPEFTPTLARMVANRQKQLTFPLRWWAFGPFWRYERPQKGRERQFYQWNCDIIGDDSIAAEAEILELIITFLQSLGLTSNDCVIEINDRTFLNTYFAEQGIEAEKIASVYRYLDKLPKLDEAGKLTYAESLGLDNRDVEIINQLLSRKILGETIENITTQMTERGLDDWIQPAPSLVRGFTYYTGLVFEVSDRNKDYRAILGGGRYNNLVATVGGEPVSGIGFGMGDAVLLSLLEDKNLLPAAQPATTVCVIANDSAVLPYSQAIAADLRQANIPSLLFTSDNFTKGLKFANQKQIPFAILIGETELQNQTVTLKNLISGEQETSERNSFITLLKRQLTS